MQEEQHIIQYFTGLLSQIKLFHWATMSYAKHKALDDLHATMSEHVDRIVESYMGRLKKQPLKKFTIETKATTDTSKMEAYLETERDKIAALCKKWDAYPDLQNIIDEMIAEMNKTLYLCRLS